MVERRIKPKPPTRETLQRQVVELRSQLPFNYGHADRDVVKACTARMAGSGVVLRLTALGGHDIVDPVVIMDGLSEDTILALRRDIKRSFDRVTNPDVKPKVP